MALLSYKCETCGTVQDRIAHYTDPPPECTECGLPTKKILSPPSPAVWKCSKGSL